MLFLVSYVKRVLFCFLFFRHHRLHSCEWRLKKLNYKDKMSQSDSDSQLMAAPPPTMAYPPDNIDRLQKVRIIFRLIHKADVKWIICIHMYSLLILFGGWNTWHVKKYIFNGQNFIQATIRTDSIHWDSPYKAMTCPLPQIGKK